MKVGELRQILDSNIPDDFEIDIVGMYSGSFGSISRIEKRVVPTPDGDYKEVLFFIEA